MDKYLFIVNPKAGKGKNVSRLIDEFMRQHRCHVDIVSTQYRGHATEIAQKKSSQYTAVIAAGGDGTVNEVVNGLKHSNSALGILPIGSGNDFARSAQLPIDDIPAALNIILKNQQQQIDVGEINGIRFINAIGIGFDGYASHLSEKCRFVGTALRYYMAIAFAFFCYRHRNATIHCHDRKENTSLFMLSINNGTYIGNGIPTAPHAKLDDGLFNITHIKKISRWRFVTQFHRLLKGQVHEVNEVSSYLTPTLTITATAPLPIHYDGEALFNTREAHIKCIPNELRLIIN